MYLINEVLNDYAKEGNRLYDTLFLQPRNISKPDDAERYLAEHARYNFLANMFNDMQIYSWRTDNFNVED